MFSKTLCTKNSVLKTYIMQQDTIEKNSTRDFFLRLEAGLVADILSHVLVAEVPPILDFLGEDTTFRQMAADPPHHAQNVAHTIRCTGGEVGSADTDQHA